MKRYGLIFISFLCIVAQVLADEIKVNPDTETKLFILENNADHLLLINSISEIHLHETDVYSGSYIIPEITGYGSLMNPGEPALPVNIKLIEVPYNAGLEIQIIRKSYRDIHLAGYGYTKPVFPAQAPVSKKDGHQVGYDFQINQQTYSTGRFYGTSPVSAEIIGIMRGVRIARLEIAPVQYNPVENILRIVDEMEILISFTHGDTEFTESQKRSFCSPYFSEIYSGIINYKPVQTEELITAAPVTYVIVSDPSFENILQPFIAWKTKKGFRVIEAYTNNPAVGNTTTSIKSYLEDIYFDPPPGYLPHSFVLLAGDVAQVPSFSSTLGFHLTDFYYTEYTGDFFPDCYCGRFSANTVQELESQITKTLEYEQFEFPQPHFPDTVMLVAGADENFGITWGNGQIFYAAENYLNQEHGIFSHIFPQPGTPNYTDSILTVFNNGISFMNYTGHCSMFGFSEPSFNLGHINGLHNTGKYPLVVGNCCSSADFSLTCFGEAMVRAPGKGALSYVGATNDTYWDEDFWWSIGFKSISANPVYEPENLGFYDRLFHDHGEQAGKWFVTQGQFPAAGNLAVTQSGSALANYYWEVYHLLGDPSVTIYMPEPQVPFVSYPSSIPPGITSLTFSTLPYRYIALSEDGILHGAALSDENGMAVMEIFEPITEPGTADVVVTGQNSAPFFGSIMIEETAGAYVLLDSYEIDDSSGNNNGLANAGEFILLGISVTNYGSATATDLSATLFSSDNFVSVFAETAILQDIPPGETIFIPDAFTVYIFTNAPNGHLAEFELEITDGNLIWQSYLTITLHELIVQIPSQVKGEPGISLKIFPNPFTDHFQLNCEIDKPADIRISLLNFMGQEIFLIAEAQNKPAGKHTFGFYNSFLDPGVYLCRIESGNTFGMIKLIKSK